MLGQIDRLAQLFELFGGEIDLVDVAGGGKRLAVSGTRRDFVAFRAQLLRAAERHFNRVAA